MKNLINALTIESKAQQTEFIQQLNEATDLNTWYYRELQPKGKVFASVELQKAYILKRYDKRQAKKLQKQIETIETIFKAPDFNSATITIEWKKSQMWGANPRAEAKVSYSDYNCNYFDSGSIGGCGYDKESTAFANALNQSNSFLKLLYQFKDANINVNNRDLFGYGAGYGILPRLEGGVGVSCFPRIFEKLGFTMRTVASGKMFNAYLIEKICTE